MKRRLFAAALILLLWLTIPLEVSAPSGISTSTQAATEVQVDSEKELINTIYTALLNRQNTITIKYTLPKYELNLNELFDEVLSIDRKKNAKDGDYLRYSIKSWSAEARMVGRDTTLWIKAKYKTTQKEEKAVDKKVKSVLKALELEEASDYDKVKAIHDYIINRVSYDTKLTKASAYDALMDKSAVCEGYSMLAYRMFTEAGLESRIISGTGNGGPHAWNIVKVEGKWYNIDLTWDDPIRSDGKPMLVYDYFLKSTKDFKGHKRDSAFTTDKFVKTYPIAKTSYKPE